MINQFDIEETFYKNLERGDESKIAENLGYSPSYISQLYNPHDPRESTLYRAILELAALIELDPGRGLRALSIFNTFVRRSVPADYVENIRSERERLMKEIVEWELTEMEGLEDKDRLKQLEDVHRQSGTLAEALRKKIYPIREQMAAAVNGREGISKAS